MEGVVVWVEIGVGGKLVLVGMGVGVGKRGWPKFPNSGFVSIESVAVGGGVLVAVRVPIDVSRGDTADLRVGRTLAANGFAIVGRGDVQPSSTM